MASWGWVVLASVNPHGSSRYNVFISLKRNHVRVLRNLDFMRMRDIYPFISGPWKQYATIFQSLKGRQSLDMPLKMISDQSFILIPAVPNLLPRDPANAAASSKICLERHHEWTTLTSKRAFSRHCMYIFYDRMPADTAKGMIIGPSD